MTKWIRVMDVLCEFMTRYPNEQAAAEAAVGYVTHDGQTLTPYRCTVCKGWHLGLGEPEEARGGWTKEPPTVQGYYWHWWDELGLGVRVAGVWRWAHKGNALRVGHSDLTPEEYGGWWMGPLEKPKPPRKEQRHD